MDNVCIRTKLVSKMCKLLHFWYQKCDLWWEAFPACLPDPVFNTEFETRW